MATTAPPSSRIATLLGLLAAATLLGLGPWPALPLDWPHGFRAHQVARVQLAALVGGAAVLAAIRALGTGDRDAAIEWTGLAMPFLAIRSKWTLLLGAACLVAQLAETSDAAGSGTEPAGPAWLHRLAGAAAATAAWLLLLSGEAVLRAAPRHATGLAPMGWVAVSSGLGLLGAGGLLVAAFQGVRAGFASPQPLGPGEGARSLLLAAAVLLPFAL